mmetsp:Transcript_41416/g.114131  ORF Transcript_41416/g.114131 Transcript_41416/m.114131 type:complete len:321 (+) Transcript_41416:120-1082(+)|eukprot:CAMPEP_0117529762 /NCGR_PEP_ID=MMETSP0784-20121206/37997_1 /TAXON_ID=39447 /ORGANISM="" /LENGTH=320 /DNA_ID=CAMNT_0005326089 /DNA_START=120 /DNA_END=1082 /DNA_ORIENTATION=+
MGFKVRRWTPANLLPVFFVCWVISAVWFLYVAMHLLTLLQVWMPSNMAGRPFDDHMYQRGFVQAIISQTLAFMTVLCMGLAMFTDPGSVPETPEWMPNRAGSVTAVSDQEVAPQYEVKYSGAPRQCKWCSCYKPDRCHHCRVCNSCILRMDHHCPWIANCVGFRNHKCFLLLVFYALTSCIFMISTMTESYSLLFHVQTTLTRRFLVIFGMTLLFMIGTLLALFFAFHVWLMLQAYTTIDFCEKMYGNKSTPVYDLGYYRNVTAVLGPNPLLWLLPCGPSDGDGLHFEVSEKRAVRWQKRTAASSRYAASSSSEAWIATS